MTTPRKRSLLSIAVVALVISSVWLLTQRDAPEVLTGASFDMPIYSSLTELARASDAEVVGTVKGVVAREIDHGTDIADEKVDAAGIPTVFYEVEVSEVLKGATDSTIVVGAPDVAKLSFSSEATPLKAGQRVLLFLKEQTPKEAPGIDSYEFFYVPVSRDNGVFDVLPGDVVHPRLPDAFAAPTGVGDVVPTFTLDEVRAQTPSR